MQRETRAPRPDWPAKSEALGFHYHSIDGIYWDESACWRFTSVEVDRLESAVQELQSLCLQAVERVVASGDFSRWQVPESFHALIRESWEERHLSLYGRFDLAWDGTGEPKMLEYNADTPTALLEASVAQWYWLQECLPEADQFNSLHEKLVLRWQRLAEHVPGNRIVHFTADAQSAEDQGNLDYLRDTALQAGLKPQAIDVADIGWNGRTFTDLEEQPIAVLFKLYPWEWLVREPFAAHLLARTTRLVEPAWKMLLSCKAILPVLWEMFPGHPNLLAASFTPLGPGGDFVKKPLYSREGANVTLQAGGRVEAAGGDYGAEGFVWQAYHPLAQSDGRHAVIGAWVVGDEPAGIGIREDDSPITRNTSRFVPHYFD